MKRTKREENGIIIHLVFYFLLTIWLIFFVITSLIPEVLRIEQDKIATKEIYSNLERVQKTWLNFAEFTKLSNSSEKDKIITEILKNMTEDFYKENLINNTDKSYSEFLNTKKEELSSQENIDIMDGQMKQISAILPTYTVPTIDLWDESLTDYKFVNYVESIIETFGLSTNSTIGINKIKLVEEYASTNTSWDSLDSNIFYIPLNLVIKGEKSGIIDFLYFIENVWKITADNNEIILNEDYWFLSKNWRKTVLEWEKYVPEYNILEHQIIDIEKITMENYIDSSYLDRGESDFKEFIVNNQWNEDFEISINLMFYVKGQPAYKTEEYINSIFQKHIETIWLISNALKDTTLEESLRRKLTQQNLSLNQMNKEIMSIKKELVKKEKLDELYKKALALNEIIDPIFKSLKK